MEQKYFNLLHNNRRTHFDIILQIKGPYKWRRSRPLDDPEAHDDFDGGGGDDDYDDRTNLK
jgi:hypothetical protein